MSRVLVLWFALAGCIDADLVVCADGRACPTGRVCDDAHHGCVDPDQLAECRGSPDFMACVATGVPDGSCFDGVCLPRGCGNGFVEPGELCDDGNTTSNDGCSADCLSREVCGDGYVDAQRGEQCDDGNLLGHDGCTSHCTAEDLLWRPIGGAPPKRQFGASFYDTMRRHLIVYGGLDEAGMPLFDTWEWNGHMWMVGLPQSAPTIRVGSAIAYDPKHRNGIMFGGLSTAGVAFLNDTWQWNGLTWAHVHPTTSPTARAGATMVWNGRGLVMFGGDGGQVLHDDTWEWDGSNWVELLPATRPPARSEYAMAYDALRDRVVLFGGHDTTTMLTDTWAFDGTTWTKLADTGPPAMSQAPVASYDPVRGVIVVCGEVAGAPVTWELDGVTWHDMAPTLVPSTTKHMNMAFDLELGQTIQFAGGAPSVAASNDIWGWNPAMHQWKKVVPAAAPTARELAAAADDPVRGRVVVFAGVLAVNNNPSLLDDLWEWDGRAWTQIPQSGTWPSGRFATASTYDPTSRRMLVYGGSANGSSAIDEMWEWDGGTWTKFAGALPTPARFSATMAYDSDRHRAVLFGGSTDGATRLGDTWEWDGAQWLHVADTGPDPSAMTAMTYDPVRHRTVLFGGALPDNTALAATWEWDGATWVRRDVAIAPEGRAAAAMVFDRGRRRVELFGGSLTYFSPWEWDGSAWSQVSPGFQPSALGAMAAVYDAARSEIVVFGGGLGTVVTYNTTWTASYVGDPEEICESGIDGDGDGTAGCADADCALACAPMCLGVAACTDNPRCGDGTCSAIESPRNCPADCAASTPLCGDGLCQAGEICPADCF